MTQFYLDPEREDDPTALPDAEVFYLSREDVTSDGGFTNEDGEPLPSGWYWWPCFPGCLPDGEPVGPFGSEAQAIADAQDGVS